MTDSQVVELARLISQGQAAGSWQFYLSLAALILVVGACGSFLGAYFQTRGTRFATSADFDEILKEVRDTTKATEEIRHSISRGGWIEQQYRVIRREKLEELLCALHEVQHWIEREREHAFFDGAPNDVSSPEYKVSVISGLYFEELRSEIVAFNSAIVGYKRWLLTNKAKYKTATLQNDKPGAIKALQEATEAFSGAYEPVVQATGNVMDKAQEIMRAVLRADP